MYNSVFIYISDALRWDYLPDAVASWGTEVKTIASGTRTPESLATILTGQYPFRHGVEGFQDLPDETLPTLFDVTDGPSLSYNFPQNYCHLDAVAFYDDHDAWLQQLRTVSDGFVAIDRDLYTHAPYPAEVSEGGGYQSATDYWSDIRGRYDKARRDYRASIQNVVDRFQHKLSILESRGLLDETLVVFTSDHGELFGEYGLVGHGDATVPELVRVPMVFSADVPLDRPDAPPVGHIDLLPTVTAALDADVRYEGPGIDLLDPEGGREMVFSEHPINTGEWGAWDGDGGHVFWDGTVRARLKWYARTLATTQNAPQNRRNLRKILTSQLVTGRTYGTPGFSRQAARQQYRQLRADTSSGGSSQVPLDEAAVERLEALGYKDDLRQEDAGE